MTAQQLKNSILQMAVQGKLVPQDPSDEPASVLLQRIKAEKQELIKAGKIKKDKKSSEIFRGASRNLPYAYCEQIGKEIRDISDEIPFEIPESWEWVRIEYLAKSSGTESFADGPFGSNLKKEHQIVTPEVRIIQLSNLGEFGWRNDNVKYTSYEHLKTISRCEVEPGNFVIAKMMPAGRTVIVPDLGTKICLGSDAIKFVPHPLIYNMYLYYAMHSDMFLNQVSAESHGVTRIRTSLNKLKTYFIPIPPLSEQHRIVAKIEELLPYIERYGKAEEQLTAINTTFPEALKKSILQEAVQGKLVPQNPDDEPASVLLECIRAEKQELIKAGRIKKDKHESVIVTRDKIPYEIIDGKERCIADEVPFEIPDSWEWVRLGIISTYNQTKQKINAKDADVSIWGLDLEDIEKGGRLLVKKSVGERKAVGDKTVFSKGDILYSKLRPYLLKILVAPDNGICTPEIVPFTVYGGISAEFIVNFLKSPYVDGLVNGETYGIKMPRAGTDTMISLLVPLPPLSEQHRIVSKIEEIMPMIERLTQR